MAFFVVAPEDAGHAEPPDSGGMPLYVFDTWLGDDLVRAHPVFLATTRLKGTLDTLPAPTGFHSARIRVERSPFLRRHRPQLHLPTFWVLEIYGQAGRHPLGMATDRSLVVSQAALDCLVQHSITHAQLSQFVRTAEPQRSTGLPGPSAEETAVGERMKADRPYSRTACAAAGGAVASLVEARPIRAPVVEGRRRTRRPGSG